MAVKLDGRGLSERVLEDYRARHWFEPGTILD